MTQNNDFLPIVNIEEVFEEPEKVKKMSKVYLMRVEGSTWAEIVKEVGVSINVAYKYYREVCKQWWQANQNKLEQILTEQLADLAELEQAFKDQAMQGDVRAAEVILQVVKVRSRLLGLDQPYRAKQINELDTSKIIIEYKNDWRELPGDSNLSNVEE